MTDAADTTTPPKRQPPGGRRTPPAELARRKEKVEGFILRGWSVDQVVAWFKTNWPTPVPRRTLAGYFAEVSAEIVQHAEGRRRHGREVAYRRSVQRMNWCETVLAELMQKLRQSPPADEARAIRAEMRDLRLELLRHEELIGKLEGTLNPDTAVNVSVQTTTAEVPAWFATLPAQTPATSASTLPPQQPPARVLSLAPGEPKSPTEETLHDAAEAPLHDAESDVANSGKNPDLPPAVLPELPSSHPVHRVGIEEPAKPLSLDSRTPPHLRVG